MTKLAQRLTVTRCSLSWSQHLVTTHHYLQRPIHPRANPFAYEINLDGRTIGTIIMATIHFTKQRELFGYPGLPTKWQVLQVARLWLRPDVQQPQPNGHASNIASCALAQMLRRVQHDWLEHHPPPFPDQPYHIRLILAYADPSAGHRGTIYSAANFDYIGMTRKSRPRHQASGRGPHDGKQKHLYVYNLPEPRWTPTMQLHLPL
jgi:hypothetical protein